MALAQDARYRLELVSGDVYVAENFQSFLKKPLLEEAVDGKIYKIVQFHTIPSLEQQNELRALGVELLNYLPNDAYVFSVKKDFDWSRLKDFNIRAVLPIERKWKQSRMILEPPFPDYARNGDAVLVLIQWYGNINAARALNFLKEKNIHIDETFGTSNFVYATIKSTDIQQVASYPFVSFLDLIPPAGEREDNDSRLLQASNGLDDEFTSGVRLNGEGVSVLVRDDGLIGPHVDFKNRVVNIGKGLSTVHHGDQVAGVLGGSGNVDATKKGIATGTKIFVTDYESTHTDTTLGLHKYHNMMVANSSYSDGCNQYTTNSQTVDNQMFNYKKLMYVFSSGNNNGLGVNPNCFYGAGAQWGNITGGHKQAKNCVAAGNISAGMVIEPTSSRGPAHDGRIKPDIVAHGTNVNATFPSNKYQANTGTSFSAPATAGVLAIMYQAYRLKNAGANPDAALMKNYLLNTAYDMGTVGPDFIYGFGNVNTKRAVQAIDNQWFDSGEVQQDSVIVLTVKKPDTSKTYKQLKIMVNWAEPNASPNSKRALINDLDLTAKSKNSSDILLPFVLDHTPTVEKLKSAARKGRDSLNNVEQIVVNNPTTFDYSIFIKGTKIPLGKQAFYITYDWIENDLSLVHPIGNESFATGEIMKIRWTTPSVDSSANVNFSYSEDDGQNWIAVGKTTLTRTFFDWKLPIKNTSRAKIRIEYGNEKVESPKTFHIVAAPKNLKITKVCPDSATFTWDLAAGANRYTILQLGNRYMDSVATFAGGSGQIKINKSFFADENWFSVRSADSLGLRGRRINAISYKGSLLNCPQSQDVATTTLPRPVVQYNSQCGTLTDSVVMTVKNVGLEYISGVKVFYKFGENAVVEKTLSDTISPLSSVTYVFPEKIIFDGVDKKTLKVWSSLTNDKFLYNDTLQKIISYNCLNTSNLAVNYPYSQNFESSPNAYPNAWSVSNPDYATTIGPFETVGASGTKSQVMAMDFTTSNIGQKDELFSVPIKIPANLTDTPYLLFDVAYGSFDVSTVSSDRLKVLAYDDCQHTNGQEIYSKAGLELSTTTTNNGQWLPNRGSNWRTEVIDLTTLKGKEIILGFQGTSQKKSILYLDNIRFSTFIPKEADATMNNVALSVCSKENLTFRAQNPDPTYTYFWNFGTSAVPSTAVGSGPITVIFGAASGQNDVQLIVKAYNSSDTSKKIVQIKKLALANFSMVKNGLTVTCTNKSTDATSYLWEFGDGTSSIEENPIHVFPKNGTYNVTLTASNDCGKVQSKRPISVAASVAVEELFDVSEAGVFPNPNKGIFDLIIDNQSLNEMEYTLTDVLGKVILTKKTNLPLGKNTIPIENKTLSAGLYFLQLNAKNKQTTLKVVVE